MRIAIAGAPSTGKTTLASSLGIASVRHTDDVMHLGWSAASDEISRWFDEPGPWCIEGVAVLRALRKWRARNPSSPPPIDRLVLLRDVHVTHTRGQQSMAKQHEKTWAELEAWLAPVLEQGQGFPLSPSQANEARSAGHHTPEPFSCSKTTKSRSPQAKPASKPPSVAKRDTPRVRGERKFSIATAPELAPDVDPRAADMSSIVTTSYLEAFERLGGVTGLVRWGRKNPSGFYRTLAALAPALNRLGKGAGVVVQVAQFGEGRADGATRPPGDDPDPA